MSYRLIDKESYYRKGVFRHFTEDCKCSVSMTARLDVTELAAYSRQSGTKFYLKRHKVLSQLSLSPLPRPQLARGLPDGLPLADGRADRV